MMDSNSHVITNFYVQAICDSFFLLFANLVYTGASHLSPSQVKSDVLKLCNLISIIYQHLPLLKSIPILLPLIHISLTGSVYTTVAVERYTTFVEALSKVRAIKKIV